MAHMQVRKHLNPPQLADTCAFIIMKSLRRNWGFFGILVVFRLEKDQQTLLFGG